MNIFDRYIIKIILSSTALVMITMLSLYSFITLADIMGVIGRGNFTLYDAFYYTLLTMPRRLYDIFPFSVLIGTMLGLSGLNSSSELVVIRAAGVSISRIILSVMKAALLLATMMIALSEYIIPVTERIAQRHYTMATHDNVTVNVADEIWIRDGHVFTNVRSVLADKSLNDISIFDFNEDRTLNVSTSAKHAYFSNGEWILEDIEQTFFSNSELRQHKLDKARWPTLLDLELVDVIISELENLSAVGLYRYASYLDKNDLDSAQYWLAFWNKIIAPFSMAAMLLLAIPFVFDSIRSSNTGSRIMIGLFIGVTFTIANLIAAQFGLVYHIYPFVSASFMTISTFLIAIVMIRKMV